MTQADISEDIAGRLELLGLPKGSYTLASHSRLQAFIAGRLTEAAQSVPSFPLEMHVALDPLLKARARYNSEGGRISVNDLLLKAVAQALMEVPEVNSSFTSDGLLRHRHADIAVAVATDHGLVTPIVRRVESLSPGEISETMRDLADRARRRRLKPDEYTGGTFSVSNLGMFGISSFGSIINPPHAAILSVGSAEQRVVVRDGASAIATMMTVTLTCDHRAIDGATGARWLAAFRAQVEALDAAGN
ncbi:2-oxo acid dehydrogenase subunit E2 [Sandaracinobacter sp. RS1-74]|uniref:2-oxo acid dehydrogenase subunit E2 n=1 Tax=Sandaracinobacteroides sayramensis TaxID=2913411 RepID=UPI001EDAE42A|nr:2-oxo acid dehydrogenase subunit E2 [Sandaracinobacteroides sayramensis]MCG2840547.1 2-oxo acid dehydrogenase subunit E2 [Sandaracinobacteroides sayramensis]